MKITWAGHFFRCFLNTTLLTFLSFLFILPIYATDYNVPGQVWQIQSGDFNADGSTDLIINTASGICIMMNNGDSTFAEGEIVLTGNYYLVVFCQLDNMAGDDIILLKVQNTGVPIQLEGYFNGDFTHAEIYPIRSDVDVEHFCASYGDFNNDNYNDIVISGFNEHPSNHDLWCYLYNLGNQQFSSPVWTQSLDGAYRSVGCGDFNEDGRDDIAFNSFSTYVYYSTGLAFNMYLLDVVNNNQYMVVADFDNDGDTDIVTNGWDGGDTHHFRFYENVPGNSFVFHEQVLIGYFSRLYSAELTGDLYPDLVTMSSGANSYFGVFYNMHNWAVQLHTGYMGSYGEVYHYCAFGKFDNHPSIDIAIIRVFGSGSNLTILFNNGTGNFLDNPITVNPDETEQEIIPEIVCYPNPCKNIINFKTNITSGFHKYTIYNFKGQLIHHLLSGSPEFSWNLCDSSGNQVKGGIYLIKEDSGKLKNAKKFIVLQ